MYLERKITRTPRWLWTVSLMEPIGAWSRKVVVANSLKNMVGPCGLEPQTSTVSNSFSSTRDFSNDEDNKSQLATKS